MLFLFFIRVSRWGSFIFTWFFLKRPFWFLALVIVFFLNWFFLCFFILFCFTFFIVLISLCQIMWFFFIGVFLLLAIIIFCWFRCLFRVRLVACFFFCRIFGGWCCLRWSAHRALLMIFRLLFISLRFLLVFLLWVFFFSWRCRLLVCLDCGFCCRIRHSILRAWRIRCGLFRFGADLDRSCENN